MNIAIIDDSKDDVFFLSRILSKFEITSRSVYSSIDFGENADPDDFDFVFID